MDTKSHMYAAVAIVILLIGAGAFYFFVLVPCDSESGTVCGTDGLTYENACAAKDAGAVVLNVGPCVEKFCDDTDFGRDMFAVGTTTDNSGPYKDSCTSAGKVKEYYCSEDAAVYEYLSCPDGYECDGGICVASDGDTVEPSCVDTEGVVSAYGAGSVTVIGLDGAFIYSDSCADSNTVREYSCDGLAVSERLIDCPESYTCSDGVCYSADSCYDSDDGGSDERYTAGAVYHDFGRTLDRCISEDLLIEFSCPFSNTTINCGTGYSCRDGRCVLDDECYDSDDGRNYFVRGTTELGTEDHRDYCTDDDIVREYYCADEDDIDSRIYTCPSDYHCSSGRCVRDSVAGPEGDGDDEDGEEGDDTICEETDAGRFDYDTQGIADDGVSEKKDECLDDGRLREYYCDGGEDGTVDSDDVSCEPGYECSVGRCVEMGADPVTCSDDDGGRFAYDLIGTTSLSDDSDSETDRCAVDGLLVEFYCDGDSIDYDKVDCGTRDQVCDGGICVDPDEESVTCEDGDGGKDDYTHAGTAKIYDASGAVLDSGTDYCDPDRESYIIEYYCSLDEIDHSDPHYCGDGFVCTETELGAKCVPEGGALPCEDGDGDEANTEFIPSFVIDDGETYDDVCVDGTHTEYYCNDLDEEDTATFLCPCNDEGTACSEDICRDTDGDDFNIYRAGTTTVGSRSRTDYCIDDDTVREYNCLFDDIIDHDDLDCSEGYRCEDGDDGGACVEIVYICDDTDGGLMYNIGGGAARYMEGAVGIMPSYDTCIDENKLREHYCDDDDFVQDDEHDCGPGRVCVEDPEGDYCVLVDSLCSDSDGGDLPNNAGTARLTDGSYSEMDECVGDTHVIEAFCDEGSVAHGSRACGDYRQCQDVFKSGVYQGDACLETCEESGGGNNPNLAGGASMLDGSVSEYDSCTGLTTIREYFCSEGSVDSEILSCSSDRYCEETVKGDVCAPKWCEDGDDGADLFTQETAESYRESATDECAGGGTYVVERTCDADTNEVVSKSWRCDAEGAYECEAGACVPVCEDTDGGMIAGEAGTVSYGSSTSTDKCSGDILSEYYCHADGTKKKATIDCTSLFGGDYICSVDHCEEDTSPIK